MVRYQTYAWIATVALATDDNYRIYLRHNDRLESGGGQEPRIGGIRTSPLGVSGVSTASEWTTAQEIPGSYSAGGGVRQAHAAHSMNNTRIYVAWQSPSAVHLVSKYLPNGTWSTIYSIYPTYSLDHSPHVSVLGSSNDAIVAYNDRDTQDKVSVVRITTAGQGFYLTSQASVKNPQISTAETPPNTVRFVNSTLSGPPYELRNNLSPVSSFQDMKDHFLAKEQSESRFEPLRAFGRKLTAYDSLTGRYWELEMRFVSLARGGQLMDVPFVAVNDTMPELELGDPLRYLATEEFDVTSTTESFQAQVRFSISQPVSSSVRESGSVRITLKDRTSGADVATLGDITIPSDSAEWSRSIRVNLPALRGKRLKLQASMESPGDNAHTVYALHHLLKRSSQLANTLLEREDVITVDPVPQDFFLGQNYPNPFNPETSISYDLPEAGHVRIDIYDILGRFIATLVDGQKNAGHHTTSWNTNGLPSGTFMYRMTFISLSSRETRTIARKMILAR
ncbi:MAG: T9SS type A sorting domain-containing protein [Ignavibacterium sp.]|jgi:hypothetical protein